MFSQVNLYFYVCLAGTSAKTQKVLKISYLEHTDWTPCKGKFILNIYAITCSVHLVYLVYRGYLMSVGLILKLLNEYNDINLFNEFNKFSNERTQIQYSVYHITPKKDTTVI